MAQLDSDEIRLDILTLRCLPFFPKPCESDNPSGVYRDAVLFRIKPRDLVPIGLMLGNSSSP